MCAQFKSAYLHRSEEFVVAHCAVAIAVEVLKQVLSFLLSQVEPIVDKAPSEIVDVKLAVTIVVHGFEDAGDSLDSSRGAIQKFGLDFLDQVVDGEGFQLLHGQGVARVGRVAHKPHVLVMLEL